MVKVPVGTGKGPTAATVTDPVRDWLTFIVLVDGVSVTLGIAASTVMVNGDDTGDGAKLESPLYVAVMLSVPEAGLGISAVAQAVCARQQPSACVRGRWMCS